MSVELSVEMLKAKYVAGVVGSVLGEARDASDVNSAVKGDFGLTAALKEPLTNNCDKVCLHINYQQCMH